MYKKLIIFFFSILLLSSCGDDNNVDGSLVLYENDNFTINIPANWEKIENTDEVLPKASIGDVELAVTSTNTVGGFANNMLILSADLSKTTTSKDYSMLNNIGAETDYNEYLKLSSKEITYLDGDTAILYEFEAKYNMESPRLKFLQTAHICNKTKAYLITIALPTNVSDTQRYANFISSFSCK